MYRSVAKLGCALNDVSLAGMDADVLGLRVVGIHAAKGGELQPPVSLDFGHHGSQGVGVSLQYQGVGRIQTAQVCQNAALGGSGGGKAQAFKGILHTSGGGFREARGGVDGKEPFRLLPGEFRVIPINHIDLPTKYSARPRRPPA